MEVKKNEQNFLCSFSPLYSSVSVTVIENHARASSEKAFLSCPLSLLLRGHTFLSHSFFRALSAVASSLPSF